MDVLFGLLVPKTMLKQNERLKIVGEHPVLGSWKAAAGAAMQPLFLEEKNGQPKSRVLDPYQLWYALVKFPEGMKSSPFKFVIENGAKGKYKWEGEGPIHNRYVDLLVIHPVDPQILGFIDDRIASSSQIKALPLVHWDDVRQKTVEFDHTSGFARSLNETSGLYITSLLPNLWVGSCPRSEDHIKELHRLGVTHVVTLQELLDIKNNCYQIGNIAFAELEQMPSQLEKCYSKHDISITFLPTRDMVEATKRMMMAPAAFLIHGLLENNQKVYVHCNCGIGRAIAAVTAYFVCVLRWTPETTEYYVGSKRPIAYFDKDGLYLAKQSFDAAFGKI